MYYKLSALTHDQHTFSFSKAIRTLSVLAAFVVPILSSANAQAQQTCGIDYVNDTTGTVYYTTNVSASWSYVCLNGSCYAGTKTGGRVQRQFGSLTLGTTYNLSFQIQDNATGQITPSCTATFTRTAASSASSASSVASSKSSVASSASSVSSSKSSSAISSSASSKSSVASSSLASSSKSSVASSSLASSSKSSIASSSLASSAKSSSSSTAACGASSSAAAVDVKAEYGEGYEFGMTKSGLIYHNEQAGATRGFAIVGLASSGQNLAGQAVSHTPVTGSPYYRYEVQQSVTQGTTYALQIRLQGNEFSGGQCIFDLSVKPGEGIVDSPCYTPGSGNSSSTGTTPPTPKADIGVVILSSSSARLVGGEGSAKPGFALYTFANDTSTTSNCTGNCAVNWPPVIVADPAKLVGAGGVTGTFGTITRSSQVTNACGVTTTITQYQATYNGKPLYFYAGDTVASDIKGAAIANWALAAADLIPQLPLVKYPAPSLLATVNGLIPKNFGFAIDIEGRKLTWRPSASNNNQSGLIQQFSPWGGEGQPVSAKDPQLELYCSNNQIQFHKVSMPGTVAGPYTAQIPAECYGKFYYFLRYRIYGTVNAEPEDNWVYTALFNYDETKPNDRFDPRTRPTVTYHSANWMRMGHPHSRDRVEEAILFDAMPYNTSLTSGLERYATTFVDGESEFNIQPHTNGSLLRIEGFEWGAGNCQGAQYMINANNPMGVGRFDYGQIISWEATFGSSQNNFPGGTAISSQVYNTMQNTTVGQGFSTATGDPRLNSSGRGGVRLVYNSGCNPVEKDERDARFAQQLTTVQDATMVNDFILGHNQFHGLPDFSGARVGDTGFANSKAIVDTTGKTQTVAGKGSCGSCHFRDGRSSFVVQTAKGPRLAPPTYGVGLLQWIEGATVGLTWDGSVPTVNAQAEAALQSDLGLTPANIGQTNFDRVVTYTRTLHVPVRDYITYTDPKVEQGEVAFHNNGCAGCHQVSQKTRSDAPVELRDIVIRPYTDMKSWDIGTGGKFRTAPLWGIGQNIGLLTRNSKATLFLHDGSATSLEQAISKHGNGSVGTLSATDKANIVTFLKTL